MKTDNIKKKICLCIDTSTYVASIAIAKLSDDNMVEIIYSTFINDGLTHSQKLLPMIDQGLSACNLETADIDLFACINGPGSFTGLRIGISTANALGESVGKSVAAIDSLEALAYGVKDFDGIIIPMIDARRENVYTAVFDSTRGFARLKTDAIKSIDEIIEDTKEYENDIMFVGCGVAKAKEKLTSCIGKSAIFTTGMKNSVAASVGVEIAFEKLLSNDIDSTVLMPNYVKGTSAKTQAERQAKKLAP